MSSIIDTIDKHDDIQLIVFHGRGTSVYLPGSEIQGYGSWSALADERIKSRGIPAINIERVPEERRTHLMSFPMIQKGDIRMERSFEFPFTPMSYAPIEVYASLANGIGAKVDNIETVPLSPEMFAKPKPGLLEALNGAMNDDQSKVAEGLLTNTMHSTLRSENRHVPPVGDSDPVPKTRAIGDRIQNRIRELEQAEVDTRGIPFLLKDDRGENVLDEDGNPKANPKREAATQKNILINSATSLLSAQQAHCDYQSWLVVAGHQTDEEAAYKARTYNKSLLKERKRDLDSDPLISKNKSGYEHLFGSLKLAQHGLSYIDQSGPSHP